MMYLLAFLVLLLCLIWTDATEGTTRYVSTSGSDANSCAASENQNTPKLTLTQAINCMAGGDTLFLRGGNYGSQVIGFPVHDVPNGSSFFAPTIFASFPGETATIRAITMVNNDAFIIFDRLHVFASPGPGGGLFMDSSAHHIRFQNGDIQGGGTNGEVLVIGNGSFLHILNSRIHGARKAPGGPDAYGMYWQGSDSLFENNDFDDNGGFGIHIFASGQSVVSRNVVRNNRIFNNGFEQGQGSFIIGSGSDNQAYNNLVYNNFAPGLFVAGWDAVAYNNTVYGNTGDGIQTGGQITTFNPTIRNNIVFNNGAGAIVNYGVGGTPVINNNHAGVCDAYSNTCGNPAFVNPGGGNFQLQPGSPARNTGVTLGLFNTDFGGVTRPQGSSWDKGAFEFVEGGGTGPLPNGNDMYLSGGGHGDTPGDGDGSVQSCINAENITTPKATWLSACQCLTVPGKKLKVRGGTYLQKIDLTTCQITGGTSAAMPTTIEGHQSEVAIFALASGETNVPVVHIANHAGHLLLNKLVLDGVNRADSTGILLGSSSNVRLTNLEIKNVVHSHLFTFGTLSNSELSGSLLHDSSSAASSAVSLGGTVNTLRIEGNHLHTIAGKGIISQSGGSYTNLLLSRNQIHAASTAPAVDMQGTVTGLLLTNNLIYENAAGLVLGSGNSGARVYNNTFASNTGVGIQCNSGATTTAITNNISFNTGTGILNNCSATLVTNMTTNPLFTNAGADDYTLLATSTAINAGTTLAEVPIAIDGAPRPQGIAYDIGAYERDAPPPTIDPTLKHRVPVYIQSWFH